MSQLIDPEMFQEIAHHIEGRLTKQDILYWEVLGLKLEMMLQ